MVAVGLGGCQSSPWSAWPSGSHADGPAKPAASSTASPASTTQASAANSARPDPQALQQVMAELQQMGAVEPAAREKLMADLKQTDPSLWPLMMQQFEAALAYRREAEKRDKAAAPSMSPAVVEAPQAIAASKPAPPTATAEPVSPQPVAPQTTASTAPVVAAVAAEVSPSKGGVQGKPPAVASPAAATSRVIQASYNVAAPIDWQAHLAAAIRQLEAESKSEGKSDTAVAQQAYLRMLYLMAGRRDEAMRPIAGATPAVQDYWSKQLYGLATWLDTDHTPDATRRAAETKRILDEALLRLGESAPLVVRNLAFCTAIQSFGSTTPFRKAEFAPDQEVLLYAELENYTVEATARGFHTAWRSSYQIFDARGQRIDDHAYPAAEEYCQSPRRDFFLPYRFRLPKRIYNGKHTLQLTIEDLKSHKVGQSSIDFTIKGGEE